MEKEINYNEITLQDCLDNYRLRNKAVVLNDGKVICFLEEDNND